MVITRASQACDAGSIPVARSSYVAPFLRTAFFCCTALRSTVILQNSLKNKGTARTLKSIRCCFFPTRLGGIEPIRVEFRKKASSERFLGIRLRRKPKRVRLVKQAEIPVARSSYVAPFLRTAFSV